MKTSNQNVQSNETKLTLNRKYGVELMRQFHRGLRRRGRNFVRVAEASDTCSEVAAKLLPYYEAFPDIKSKAEQLVDDWQIIGLDETFGDITIYPESFNDTSASEFGF